MLNWEPSPILIKEMRSTMRGRRTFTGLTLFLLFLTGLSFLVYYGVTSGGAGSSSEVGRIIFGFLGVIEFLMLAVVTPPLTSGAIASERQGKTFDMLMATPLTPRQILRGKLFASMNYLFLLIFASLPINAIVFLFGGVSPSALWWWLAFTVTILLMLGTFGLWMSTLFQSGGVATSITYLAAIGVFIFLPICVMFNIPIFLTTSAQPPPCEPFAMLGLLHPAGSLAVIIAGLPGLYPRLLLPATLSLYGALAGLFFIGAEARLSKLASQRWRGYLWALLFILVAVGAVVYLVLVPVQEVCL